MTIKQLFKRYLNWKALKFFAKTLVAEKSWDLFFTRELWGIYNRRLLHVHAPVGSCPMVLEGELPVEALFTATSGFFLLRGIGKTKLLSGRFTGLTRKGDRYYIAEELFQTKRCRIFSCTFDGERVRDLETLFVQKTSGGIHQIDFVDDLLFVTDSHNNSIIVLESEGGMVCRIFPNGVHTQNRPMEGTDSRYYCHYNSLFGWRDGIAILAHNETKKTGRKSLIYWVDKKDYSHIDALPSIPAGSNGHNILIHRDQHLVCDSLHGSLINNGQVVLQTEYFTRGLAMNDEYTVVGCSERVERHQRTETKAFLWILGNDFAPKAFVELGSVGQLYDIRLLPKDYGLSNEAS